MFKRLICSSLFLVFSMTSVFASTFSSTTTIIRPSDLIIAEDGSVIFTDMQNNALFELSIDGEITQITGESRKISVGDVDGEVDIATFNDPWGITPYLDGYAITDSLNNKIRYYNVSEGIIQTIAGSESGYVDGSPSKALFNRPTGIDTMEDGTILIADTDNNVIRSIDEDGNVETFAGSVEGDTLGNVQDAKFKEPTGIHYVDGVLYVADTGNNRIVKIEDDEVSLVTGVSGVSGFKNGSAENALFSSPISVYFDDDTLYISDSSNGVLRKLADGKVSTLIDTGALKDGLTPVDPRGIDMNGDELWFADTFSGYINCVDVSEKEIYYKDVNENSWFYEDVTYMGESGILNGVSSDEFSPNSSVTRAMFVTTLSRIEENINPYTIIDGDITFPDVPVDTYYTKPVIWAASTGITTGSNGNFLPNNSLTRAECVTFLYRYANSIGFDMSLGDISSFVDATEVPDYAKDAISWATNNGILTGKDGNLLAPNENISRAELSAILSRFYKMI